MNGRDVDSHVRRLLERMVERGASDVYLTAGSPPVFRVEGISYPSTEDLPLEKEELEAIARSMLDDRRWARFQRRLEMNFALTTDRSLSSRFRVNVFMQRSMIGIVIRRIAEQIPGMEALGLPRILEQISLSKRGLVLVVGATGSGKSTTLASMIDHRNATTTGHIISIEDPIEYMHEHRKSIVSQREIGFDTRSYREALKNAMRQAPDVVLIGEIRDSETMEVAITLADTGHLCLATLHSMNSNQSFERIINFFPAVRHPEIFLQLSLNLRAIISQRLVNGIDGRRVAALEILLDTARIKDLIKKADIDGIRDAMEQSALEGCQTFDMALFDLYRDGRIGVEQALANADSPNNLRLRIRTHEAQNSSGLYPDAVDELRLAED